MTTAIKTTYNFKTLKAQANNSLANVLAEYDPSSHDAIKALFDIAENGDAKRKSIEVELTMPEFYDKLPDDLSRRVIQRTVEDFVKALYVDQFQPVGQHDWQFIAATMAESARRGGSLTITVSDEQWQLAAATVAAYWESTGKPAKVGKALADTISGKFTINAIRKNIGRDDADTIAKLETYISDWASYVAENDPENADDVGAVFAAIGKKIDKMLKREATEAVADLL